MKLQLYFPSLQGKQILWLNNFQFKLSRHASTFDLTPEKLASALADLAWIIYFRGTVMESVRRHGLACTAAAKALMRGKGTDLVIVPLLILPGPPEDIAPVKPGALDRIFKLVNAIKRHANYTKVIGIDLGIVGNLHQTRSLVPTFNLKTTRGQSGPGVKGRFGRHGHRAVQVETRRGDGEWEILGHYTGSIFLDKRPLLDPAQPEIRHYRLRFWDDAKPASEWTVVSSVTVSP